MKPISTATLGGALAPASISGRMGGASVHGRIGAARLGGTVGAAALGGTLNGVALAGSVSIESGLPPVYAGPYEATPQVTKQSLPTQGKRMASDVTVHGIPYAEVTNESGGYTATIG